MKDSTLYKVVLLLGSNLPLGNLCPKQIIEEAGKEIVDALLPDYLEVDTLQDAVNATEIVETEPCGPFEKQLDENGEVKPVPSFSNQVLVCQTALSPQQVLLQTQRIERLFGRMRTYKVKGEVYQSRTLDIDILQVFEKQRADKVADRMADKNTEWVEIKSNTESLILPHPQIETRGFVKPLLKKLGL